VPTYNDNAHNMGSLLQPLIRRHGQEGEWDSSGLTSLRKYMGITKTTTRVNDRERGEIWEKMNSNT
jgi:hypothetical protein